MPQEPNNIGPNSTYPQTGTPGTNDRDMSSFNASTEGDSAMRPTPRIPTLAHCCACNAKELSEARYRQRTSESECNFRETLCQAVVAAREVGDYAESARSFLKAVFDKQRTAIQEVLVIKSGDLPSLPDNSGFDWGALQDLRKRSA